MSRNFELLQQADKDKGLFQTAAPMPARDTLPEKPVVVVRPTDSERPVAVRPGKISGAGWLTRWRPYAKRIKQGVNGNGRNGHALFDLKAMTLQEEIKLVQRVFLTAAGESRKAIIFSGIEKGSGSAHICARAAETLAAQVKGTVCVVDANLHAPSLHQYFRVGNILGLSEALLQNGPIHNYAQQMAKANLWLIPCGSAGANSSGLLSPESVRARIEELRTQFDYVLINVAPMDLFADSALLSQLADGVVFVVEANSTRREAAQRLKESLEAAKVRVLGVVLNNRTFPIPEAVYRKL